MELLLCKQEVEGSSPIACSIFQIRWFYDSQYDFTNRNVAAIRFVFRWF